jgi:Txe/YoeB family toxin of Txe-Axe toxin-antitoxin module
MLKLILLNCVIDVDSSIIATLIIGIAGIVCTAYYSKQKQKIENDNIFKSLFESFNARYDNRLNDLLNEIKLEEYKILEKFEKELIIDYLNLCSEEYLWYREKRIPRYVWTAWKAGIVENLNIPQVKEIYLKETKTERQRKSFYGLCEEIDIK